ncbi:MAG: NIL domain-containing protein [Planctomycetota bacterium]|nr:NIL domain-containing protein [Planctomycetota bacterium]MDI6787322.1 NIL domain-containing protein [Planctomycetota bacterium]
MATGDKRRDSRIPIKGGMVQYKEAGGGLFAIFKGASEQYPILNISTRGMRFLTADTLSKDDKLSFSVIIPILGGEPLKVDGRVAWVKSSPRFNADIVGVQFTAMTKKSIHRLKNLIEFLGKKIKIKQTVKILFSEQQRQQPTLWQLARDFNVNVNIIDGSLTDVSTWMVLRIEGEKDEVMKVLEYLKEGGARILAVQGK